MHIFMFAARVEEDPSGGTVGDGVLQDFGVHFSAEKLTARQPEPRMQHEFCILQNAATKCRSPFCAI